LLSFVILKYQIDTNFGIMHLMEVTHKFI
jgi:hypothetical protein